MARAFAAQPSLARLADDVEAEGARYTLLARLSPIPSWLNNYGLAFAGVRFADYVPATALASALERLAGMLEASGSKEDLAPILERLVQAQKQHGRDAKQAQTKLRAIAPQAPPPAAPPIPARPSKTRS